MDYEKEVQELAKKLREKAVAEYDALAALQKKVKSNVEGKVKEEVEQMKSRIPWKGMLIFLGVATVVALVFKGLVY